MMRRKRGKGKGLDRNGGLNSFSSITNRTVAYWTVMDSTRQHFRLRVHWKPATKSHEGKQEYDRHKKGDL